MTGDAATRQVSFSVPDITEEEIAEVVEVLRSGWLTTGPRVQSFEDAFSDRVHASAALGLSSCTAALHTALAVLGVGPGDAVVVPTMTFCSTAHVVEHVGATPVLADVEPETLTLDPARADAAVDAARSAGLRPRALIPVHFAGHPCEMSDLEEIARRNDLAIVEDAAHALPAAYKGRMVGAPIEGITSFAAFSFYATKNLTTGEGGMLTGSVESIELARVWSLHGMSRDAWNRYAADGSWRYDVTLPGFKYNMTDLEAALGLVQLRRLDDMQAQRRRIVGRYADAFAEEPGVEIPVIRAHVGSALHLFVLRLDLERLRIDRDGFMRELRHRGIGTSVHFIPVHEHRYYRERYDLSPGNFPVASREFSRLVSLPLHPKMSDEDTDAVIGSVLDVARANRR